MAETKTERVAGQVRALGGVDESFEALCPFRHGAPHAEDCLVALPQRTFLPRGLMLWGVPDGACVNIFVGRDLELVVEYGPIPAKWFAALDSFAQVAAAVDAGKEPPGWGKWDIVRPGLIIRLEFSKHNALSRLDGGRLNAGEIQALMWGHAVP